MKLSRIVRKLDYIKLKLYIDYFKENLSNIRDKKELYKAKRTLKRLLKYFKKVEDKEKEERIKGCKHGEGGKIDE